MSALLAESVPVSAVTASVPYAGTEARAGAIALDDEQGGTFGIDGTPQQEAPYRRTTSPMDAIIEDVLAAGGTLTDEQITYLHRERGWSANRIAFSGGLRGQKQARLERIHAVLGTRTA